MAKSKALIAAEAKIAALEARIAVAKTVYMDQKAKIAELEAALAAAGFRVEEVFGGMRREAWDAGSSPDTVVLARR